MTWILELPYDRPPKGLSANYRGHWAPKAKSTAEVRLLVVALARNVGIPTMGRMQVELVWVVTDNSPEWCVKIAPRIEKRDTGTAHFELIVTDITHRPERVDELTKERLT